MLDDFEAGCMYHVFNHAIGKENLFRSEDNYRYFLSKFAQYVYPVAETFAYCLMPNHFHFFIRIRSFEEVKEHFQYLVQEKKQNPQVFDGYGKFNVNKFIKLQFGHFLNGYAQAYNKRYQRKGGLFLHFLKCKLVDSPNYRTRLIHYVHFNPVHHEICRSPCEWIFSSYHAYLSQQKSKLAKNEALDWFGGESAFLKCHHQKPDKEFVVEFE